MSWMEQIKPDSGIWRGVEEYANKRIAEMTSVCVSLNSSDTDVRQAQARIDELQRLLSVPSMIKATASQRQANDQTKGY
jgi:hypothetical protein